MPLVALNCNSSRVSKELAAELAQALPDIVAPALHVEENAAARLTSNEVEVWYMNPSDLDVNGKDVAVLIWAGYFPERQETLGARRSVIEAGVVAVLSKCPDSLTGYVEVLLQPLSYGEFQTHKHTPRPF